MNSIVEFLKQIQGTVHVDETGKQKIVQAVAAPQGEGIIVI